MTQPLMLPNRWYLVKLTNPFGVSSRECEATCLFMGIRKYLLRFRDGSTASYEPSEVTTLKELTSEN